MQGASARARALAQAPMRRAPAPQPSVEKILSVRAVGGQGDGLAVAEDGSRAFLPLTLAGERARASVAGDRGELIELLETSPERVEPPCPHFGECGGCALQHWDYEAQLAWKREQVRQVLAREGLETEVAPGVPAQPETRRRVALHARPGRGGAVLGYKARRSWRLVEIAVCPISDRRIVEALPGLRKLAAAFLDHPKSAPTLHVTLTRSGLDVDVTGVERKSGGMTADRKMQAAEAAAEAGLARLTLAGEPLYVPGQRVVRLGQALVELPAGAFMQATPQAEVAMVAETLAATEGATRVADLFCGMGTFTFPLVERAPVLAVDGAADAVAALKAAAARTHGLKPVETAVRDLFRNPVSAFELKGCDAVVFDPPRAGALDQARQIAESGAAVVVGVSCNPTTFARDARVLVDGGFRLERVTPVDQFLWSAHIELVGVFRR